MMNASDLKTTTIINEQRFIDINIDSETDEPTPPEPIENNDKLKPDKKFLFNFKKNKNKNPFENPKTAPKPTLNALSLNEATDILLSNLNELDLNYYSEEDEDEEDDDTNQANDKIRTDNLFKLHQKLQRLESLNKEVVSQSSTEINDKIRTTDHSTPLRSKSYCSIENLNDEKLTELSLNCSSSSSDNNRTLSFNEKNNCDPISKKNSLQKDLLTRFHSKNTNNLVRNDSIVDGLLGDIYDRFNVSFKESFDSDVFTELSLSSTRFSGTESRSCIDSDHESESRFYFKNSIIANSSLKHLSVNDLKDLVNEMSSKVNQISAKLIRQLRQKDKLASKLNRNCDILTALLQAKSLKRRVDTQMKFTLDPMPGELGFMQWKDAMKALARLPGGIPKEFRKSVWLNLSQKYIKDINLDWNKVRRIAFNDRSNPDDDELGIQIVKDLHRTGCSTFSGDDSEQDRALLKRVLLAFARYNKTIGYCQGFNIIAALILEIVDKKEEDALMCMIYLIDHILPEGYFTNSMHSLAIDMAVFRELLKSRLPKLCQHLNSLQFNSIASSKDKQQKNPSATSPTALNKSKSSPVQSITNYEPPLTNVFTMQWFLTLFATCLPKNVLLRVWDCIYLEGAEILFRTSIAIWDKLSVSVIKAQSADAFYSMMSILTIKLFDQNVIDENDLINKIYSYGSFPLNGIEELREKFTFSITPFQMLGLQQNSKNNKSDGLSSMKLQTSKNVPTDTLINTSDPNSEGNESSDLNLKNDLAALNKSEEFSLSLRTLGDDQKKSTTKSTKKIKPDDEDDFDDEVEDLAKMISCFALLMPARNNSVTNSSSTSSRTELMMTAAAAASTIGSKEAFKTFTKSFTKQNVTKLPEKDYRDDISKVTPGAFSYTTQMHNPKPLEEHLTLDLNELKKQYKKLKERQRQAHVIIQTASDQHRLKTAQNSGKNMNLPTSSNHLFQSHRILTKTESCSITSSSELIVNHLLMKSNDPTCNLVKKSIQINTDSSNRMVTESVSDNQFASIIKTDLARNSSIESYEKEIMEKKKEQNKKKVYYSDDEDDDDDDDDDLNDDIFETNDNNITSKVEEPSVSNQSDKMTFNEVKSLTLIDLSNLNESNRVKNDNSAKELSSSSSSSSFESPNQNDRLHMHDNNNNCVYDDFSLSGNLQTTIQTNPKPKTSKLITSSIILNLANEEKRHMTPLNPFPNRHINTNVAKNGMRLGLYKF